MSSWKDDPRFAAFFSGEWAATAARARQSTLETFDDDALAWMAVAPAWTPALARASRFPAGGEPHAALFRRMVEVEVAETAPAADPDAQAFWSSDWAREAVLDRLVQQGAERARQVTATVGRAVLEASATGAGGGDVAGLRLWADLARFAGDSARLSGELLDRIRAAVAPPPGPGETQTDKGISDDDLSRATRWTEAAAALQPVVGEQLATALARAQRWIQLGHRLTHDRRRLASFFHRPDQAESFTDLMTGAGGVWALHFVGPGGVGKTMLARHIGAQLAPQLGAACARIDFDHINPDYPFVAPWMLLELLAEQLRPYEKSTTHFFELDKKILHVRELAADAPPGVPSPELDEAFDRTLSWFTETLVALERPVVLILDTCEELAKVRPDGDLPSNVKRTFELLEKVRADFTGLRVVFCGRRPLAGRGAGWRCEPPVPLPDRPYLALHEVHGFDRDEAVRFVATVPSEVVRDAILARAEEPPPPPRFHPDPPAPVAADRTAHRFNPYELAFGRDWMREETDVARDPHEYTRVRIIDRVPAELAPLLPALALLRRTDRAALRGAWTGPPERFEAAFVELARQEWTVAAGSWIELERAMLRRLVDYYQAREREAWRERLRVLARHLMALTSATPPADAPVEHFEACLRLLVEDGAFDAAAGWWRGIEAGFTASGRFDRLEAIGARLLADDQPLELPAAAEPGGKELRAAVMASYAAGLGHVSPQLDRRGRWEEVQALAGEREDLRQRAIAGQIAAAAATGAPPAVHLVSAFIHGLRSGPPVSLQLLAAYVAALEALVELAEREVAIPGMPDAAAAKALLSRAPKDSTAVQPRAFLSMLVARLHLLQREAAPARLAFVEALATWRPGPVATTDWRPPDDLDARLVLEYLRAAEPGRATAIDDPASVLGLLVKTNGMRLVEGSTGLRLVGPGQSGGVVTGVDRDRAASALLALQARVDGAGVIARPLADDGVPPRPLVARNALDEVPPLAVTWAELRGRQGHVDEALATLTQITRRVEERAGSVRSASHADQAVARLRLRMRLGERDGDLPREGTADRSVEGILGDWAAKGLAGVLRPGRRRWTDPTLQHPAAWWWRLEVHARWRALSATTREGAAVALSWAAAAFDGVMEGAPPAMQASADRVTARLRPAGEVVTAGVPRGGGEDQAPAPLALYAALILDLAEAVQLALAHGIGPAAPLRAALDELLALDVDAGSPAEATVLRIRRGALTGEIDLRHPAGAWIAGLALDEGQLLALRLPRQAAPLLEEAARGLEAVGERASAFIARVCRGLALARATLVVPPELLDGLRGAAGFLPIAQDLPWPDSQSPQEIARWAEAIPAAWRPWMFRALACIARATDRRSFVALLAAAGWEETPTELGMLAEKPAPRAALAQDPTIVLTLAGKDRDKLVATLGNLAGQPPPEAPVLLKLDRAACPEAWEGLLASHLEPSWGRVRICREMQRSRPQRPRTAENRLWSWSPRSSLSRFVVSMSGPLDEVGWDVFGSFDLETTHVETWALHIVAVPLPTSRGVRLRQSAAAAYRKQALESRGTLTAATDILEAFPALAFAILQTPPAVIEERSAAEGQEASLLRAFAGELAEAGVATLVVPPLDPELAFQVLVPLAPALARAKSPFGLAAAATEVRHLIAQRVSPDAAGDCCFYVGAGSSAAALLEDPA